MLRKVFLDDLPHSKSGKTVKWCECVGREIDFIYDGIKGTLNIVDYKTDGKHAYLNISYGNKIQWITSSSLQRCIIGSFIGANKKPYTKSWEYRKYKHEIGDIVNERIITSKKVEFDGKQYKKYYKYKCLKCGFDCGEHYLKGKKQNDVWFTETQISNIGCPCCSSKRVVKEIKSIYATNNEFIQFFNNIEDSYKYTVYASSEIETKCPLCGHVKKDKIKNLSAALLTNGYSCPMCGDGFSYPNKFMYNLLTQLTGIKFIREYSPDWLLGKKFDFYIPSKNLVIEMDGGLGHGNRSIGKISSKQSLEVDKWKDEQANINDLTVVRIDCFISSMQYIKNNILNSALVDFLDLSNIIWEQCDKYAQKNLYLVVVDEYNSNKSKEDIASELDIKTSSVEKYLRNANKMGLINYIKKNCIGVCQYDMFTLELINTYDSIEEAARTTNINRNQIKKCCLGIYPIAGLYIWRFYGEKAKQVNFELLQNIHRKVVVQYDMELNRINIFNSISEASIQTNINKQLIMECCKKKYSMVGGYIWRYLFDISDIESGEYTYKNPREKEVIQYDLMYTRVAIHDSVCKAADSVGVHNSSIVNCCNRKTKICNGYIWRYADDCEDMELKTFNFPTVFLIGQYKDDNTLVNTYKTIKEATLYTGINRLSIGYCLNKKQKTAGGFIWKRIYEMEGKNS